MSDLSVSKLQAEPNPLNIDLLTRTICKGASADELALFVQICKKTGLDPFSRQIFAVKRWDRKLGCEIMQPQVSIDGFRLVAQRSGEYAGQTAVQWCGDNGEWRDVWLSRTHPVAARVGVYRRGFSEACYAVALWSEYCPIGKDGKPTGMWPRMPALMLAKCAEALALRKSFPAELSGLYTSEEMDQDNSAPPPPPASKAVSPAAMRTLPPKERSAETRRLLASTREEFEGRSPAPAAPSATASHALAEPAATADDIFVIPAGARIAAVKTPKGEVWRVDIDGREQPIAVRDPSIASGIEANLAFSEPTYCRLTNDGRRDIVTEIVKAPSEVSA